MKSVDLTAELHQEQNSSMHKVGLVLRLSLPAILAQLTSIAMQYIDAGMVGNLGAQATAAIGIVSSTTWLIGGSCIGMSTGFSVQVAQLIGAEKNQEASGVLKQALSTLLLLGLLVGAVGLMISGRLPHWLGAEQEICHPATVYFAIYSCSIPFALMRQLSASMMQSTGDMRTPSILSAAVCILDVIFNMVLIFPTRTVAAGGLAITIPGAGLGVTGAALGTALAEVVISFLMLYCACFRNKRISVRREGSWRWKKKTILTAMKVAIPLSLDHIFMCGAQVAATKIVAPLGTIAVAANSLSVTAESLCYMPGYGIGAAATAIIGQTIGASRKDLTKSFSRISVYLGMILMGLCAIVMYFLAPFAFSLLTSDPQVAALGTRVLRIELLAEPLYGVSICCAGVFRGAGDTLKPSIMNLISMWGVRLPLALILIPHLSLAGYWTAMAIELCFRGIIFLVRLYRGKWMKGALV